MFTIMVSYKTGNSYGSEDDTEIIPISWNDIELAKLALKELDEHYIYAKDEFSYGKDCPSIETYDKPWFNKKEPNYTKFSVLLMKDNGERQSFSVPWTGYFESVYYFKIILDDNDPELCINVP